MVTIPPINMGLGDDKHGIVKKTHDFLQIKGFPWLSYGFPMLVVLHCYNHLLGFWDIGIWPGRSWVSQGDQLFIHFFSGGTRQPCGWWFSQSADVFDSCLRSKWWEHMKLVRVIFRMGGWEFFPKKVTFNFKVSGIRQELIRIPFLRISPLVGNTNMSDWV